MEVASEYVSICLFVARANHEAVYEAYRGTGMKESMLAACCIHVYFKEKLGVYKYDFF